MSRKSSIIRVITAALVAVLIAAMAFTATSYAEGKPKQSSFEYKQYGTHELYKKALSWRMGGVFNSISGFMDDSGTLPIPGIVKTYSSLKGKKKGSDQFIPQGICRAGPYWLITAYDAKRKFSSVIYAVDPAGKKIVSTVALPNRFHAGGIAFDGRNIWMTGDTSDKYQGDPFLQYIGFDDFCRMIRKPFYIASKDEVSDPVYIKNKPSFLEYDEQMRADGTAEGTLWVGTYIGKSSTTDAYMYGYKVIPGDEPRLNTIFLSVISGIDSSAQGADIVGNDLYVSSSYNGMSIGVRSSFVTKYDIKPIKDGKQSMSVTSRELTRIEVPKMNEEILIENGRLYINFESASEMWKFSVINTDRILSLKLPLWD